MKTIVVTGSHSVGKTMLCQRLVDSLSGSSEVAMIPEMARILIARGITMNDEVTEFGMVSYVLEYLRHTRMTTAKIVVSDRSVFDLYAYISISHADGVREEFVSLVEEIVRQEVQRVFCYVYVPIEFEMQADGVRPSEVTYQRTVDLNIQKLLRQFGAGVLTVSGTVDERASAVRRYLNS